MHSRCKAKNHLSDSVAHEDENLKIVNTHVPMGVVGAIAPWNFPLILSNLKIISSLITGNCVIVKPSPFTPYTTMKAIEYLKDVVPAGVLQVLNGGGDLGVAMTLHPGIAKISFTGSIATGRRVMANCAKTMKRVTLELGGNDAAIVCEDVDVPEVAGRVANGAFFNSGQMCVATKRVYVHESIYDAFLDEYVKAVEAQFKAGGDAGAMTSFGPLSNRQQFDIVKGYLEDSKKNNYKIVSGGKVGDKGFWIEPTVVSKPPEDSRLVQEEQFGKFPACQPGLYVNGWRERRLTASRAHRSHPLVQHHGGGPRARQPRQRGPRCHGLLGRPAARGEHRAATRGGHGMDQHARDAAPGSVHGRRQGKRDWRRDGGAGAAFVCVYEVAAHLQAVKVDRGKGMEMFLGVGMVTCSLGRNIFLIPSQLCM